MSRVFITGATGFIGRELIKQIANKKRIVCFVRENSDLNLIKELKLNFVVGDLRNKQSIYDSLKKGDIVIHLATSHESGKENINLISSINLIESCKEKKVRRIIFVSSMAANRKYLDNYGKTKLEIEQFVKDSGLEYIILRPSIIYSRNNLSLIGSTLKSIPFVIPVIGSGNYKMNPVYVQDVIKAIQASIKTSKKNKTYDVAGAENIRFNEIVNLCKDRFKIKKLNVHVPIFLALLIFRFIPIISQDAIKGINEDSNADITLLKKNLNVNTISFREGIKNVNL